MHARCSASLDRSGPFDAIHFPRVTPAPSQRCLLNSFSCAPLSRCKLWRDLPVALESDGENAGNSQSTVQAYVRTGSRAHSRAGRYCSNGSASVHLRHALPLALVRTKTRLARRRGFHVNKYRQSQSGWSLPCLHGRRRITQTAVGSVPFSHKYVEQQWKNKINICGQHCCTGAKLNVDILPDSASYVRQQGQRQTGEQQ